MPPKKSLQHLEQAQMKALETLAQKHAALGSDTAAEDLWDQLQAILFIPPQIPPESAGIREFRRIPLEWTGIPEFRRNPSEWTGIRQNGYNYLYT